MRVAKGPARWLLGLSTLAVALLAVIPIYWVTYIPANDYPFHLARIAILSLGDKSALFGTHYQFGSWLLPNMALDAVALPLTLALSPEMAVKLFLAVMQCAFLAGCMALHAAAFKRLSAWPLLCGLLLYNGIFTYGFYNYLFASALALLGAALWLTSAPGWGRRLVALGVALVVMWAHMGGYAIYAILVGAFALRWHLLAIPAQRLAGALKGLVLDVAPLVVALLLFLLVSPGAERAADGFSPTRWWGAKPAGALFTLQSSVLPADLVAWLALAGLVLALLLARRLTVNRSLLLAAGLLWLAFLVLPFDMLGSLYADVRIVPLAALVTLVAFAPTQGGSRLPETLVLAVALVAGGAKTGLLMSRWSADQPGIDRIVQAMRTLPGGATLFAATAAPYPIMWLSQPGAREAWHPPLKHVASYASVYASVFVPMTFADRYKQPMVMVEGDLAIKALQGDNPFKVPTTSELAALARKIDAQSQLQGGRSWADVYLLVVGTDRYPALPVLDGFGLFGKGEGFAIYRHIPHAPAAQANALTQDSHG